jgi:hypothetical protein
MKRKTSLRRPPRWAAQQQVTAASSCYVNITRLTARGLGEAEKVENERVWKEGDGL